MASVRWLGHASFEVGLEGSVVYFDPWFDKAPRQLNRLVPPFVKNVDDIKKADIIFISHEHFDHCDPYDVTRMVERTFAMVIGPDETLANLTDVSPRRKMPVHVGDNFELHGLNISVVPARHPQSVNPCGYVVEKNGKRVYFAGDTYEFPEMNKINVDVALLPIGGTYTMDYLGAIGAVKRLKADFVVPMHFNTFDQIQTKPEEFVKRVSETHTVPKLLEIGQTFDF